MGDKKYSTPEEISKHPVSKVLLELGASPELAFKVQTIVKHVSYSAETKDPLAVEEVLLQHPELAAVQDADRLDAIGAVGIGRAFTFGGAMRPETNMAETIQHFTEKLERLEGLMKVRVLFIRMSAIITKLQTRTGKQMARERTRRLQIFRTWWEEETTIDLDGLPMSLFLSKAR